MNKFTGICLIPFIILFFGNNSGFSQDFPTDIGSIVISGSFSSKSSDDTPFADYKKRVNLSGSFNYLLFLDVSLGIWTEYEKNSSGSSYRSDFAFGPQLNWYIGGHMHKTELGGDFYQYFGLGILHRKWKRNQHVIDTGNGDYELSTHSSYMYRLSFGMMILVNSNIGVFGEAAANLFISHQSSVPAGEATLDFGLILFLY